LINKPQVWATIFVTQDDRRSFVEMCLERSLPAPLEVTVTASEEGQDHPLCTCDRDRRERLLPDETDPCEWHFVFEALAESRHSKRIRVLNIRFGDIDTFPRDSVELALGSCRFFTLPFLQLTTLEWEDELTPYANHLFSVPPFPPTLHSLSFEGSWHSQLTQVNNLTSLALECYMNVVSAETFRTLLLNNRSLETLSLQSIDLEGSPNGPPARLSDLKSFSVRFPQKILSSLICVPAFQRLSSLYVSYTEGDWEDWFTFRATGDGIMFSVASPLPEIVEDWKDLTGHARPTIHYVRLQDYPRNKFLDEHEGGAVICLFEDAHTLEIGYPYTACFYPDFLDDLKQLGPQLKTIRFELPAETEPFQGTDKYDRWDGCMLDDIEDLVGYRFEQGRPFSSVERMVVSESERTNRLQDYVWRCFRGRLERYVRPV